MTTKIKDPHHLNRVQYATADKLLARRSIYQYCRPPLDIKDEIIKALKLKGDEAILDVGCGDGDMLTRLLEQHRHRGRLVGVDPSGGMIKAAQTRAQSLNGQVEFLVGRTEQLPFADAAFDVVLGLFMLYHVPDIQAALHEWRRVLKPGGRIVAATSSASHLPKSGTFKHLIADLLSVRPTPLFSESFNLKNGGLQLAAVFGNVEPHRFGGTLRLNDPAPYLALLDSARDMYEPVPSDEDWSRALDAVREKIEAEIAKRGIFTDTVSRGFFVAHR